MGASRQELHLTARLEPGPAGLPLNFFEDRILLAPRAVLAKKYKTFQPNRAGFCP
jgi:hypothetical protein